MFSLSFGICKCGFLTTLTNEIARVTLLSNAVMECNKNLKGKLRWVKTTYTEFMCDTLYDICF